MRILEVWSLHVYIFIIYYVWLTATFQYEIEKLDIFLKNSVFFIMVSFVSLTIQRLLNPFLICGFHRFFNQKSSIFYILSHNKEITHRR